MSQAFKALCVINRGREVAEIQPGTLFVPDSAKQRDELIALDAIAKASEAEQALFDKQNAGQPRRSKPAPVEPETEIDDAGDDDGGDETTPSRNDAIATLVDDNDRPGLNELAAKAGVESPEEMANKRAVAEAIVDAGSSAATDIVG